MHKTFYYFTDIVFTVMNMYINYQYTVKCLLVDFLMLETWNGHLKWDWVISCIKYWLKILDMQDDRFVKKCYIMLLKDDSNGKVNWATGVRTCKCLYSAGLWYIWENMD